MSCDWVEQRLVPYQDGELGPSERLIVTEHLQHCLECSALESSLAHATPEPFLMVPNEQLLHLHSVLQQTLDTEFSAPRQSAPPSSPQRWASWLRRDRDMSNGTIIAYGLLLAACISWGVANWIAVRSLTPPPTTNPVALQSDSFAPSGQITSDQYRPAGYELQETTEKSPEEYWR